MEVRSKRAYPKEGIQYYSNYVAAGALTRPEWSRSMNETRRGIGLTGGDLTPNHKEPCAAREPLLWILENVLELVW